MPQSLFYFTWPVPQQGFQWITTVSERLRYTSRWLTNGVPLGRERQMRLYQPLEERALFRRFAKTPTTEEGVLQFANKYGMLGVCEPIVLAGAWEDPEQLGEGERLQTWQEEIQTMRAVIELWDALKEKDSGDINWRVVRAYIRSAREINTSADAPQASGTRARRKARRSVENGPETLRGWTGASTAPSSRRGMVHYLYGSPRPITSSLPPDIHSDDLITLAHIALAQVVTERLQEKTNPGMLYLRPKRGLRLFISPDNLLGALWVQCAQAIDTGKAYYTCLTCGGEFEVSQEAFRTDRRYCRDSCRSRAYRERQATAQRLHAEGQSLEAIAKQVESDLQTVRGWITHHRSRRRSTPSQRGQE